MDKTENWNIGEAMTTADLAFDRMRRAILSGELPHGERLTELNMAKRLNVSRTPVRDAFSRLQQAGLVHSGENGQLRVVDIRRDVIDIYYLSEAVEGIAARLATLRGTKADFATIERLCDLNSSLDPKDVEQRSKVNGEYHLAIVHAAHSPRILTLVAGYREILASPHILRRYRADETEHALLGHRNITEAILQRDADRAEYEMRVHLRFALQRIVEQNNAITPDDDGL